MLDEYELEPHTRELLLENVRRLLTPHPVKIRAGENRAFSFSYRTSTSTCSPMRFRLQTLRRPAVQYTRSLHSTVYSTVQYCVSAQCEQRTRAVQYIQYRILVLVHTRTVIYSSSGSYDVLVLVDMEVSCLTYEGVESIRAALRTGAALSTEAMPLHVALIAPPTYVLSTTTLDRSGGLARLNEVLGAVRAEIERRGGKFSVKMPVRHCRRLHFSLHYCTVVYV